MNRKFLQLAHEFDNKKHNPYGWYLSIKLDGHRAFWDGGFTRGMDPKDVPWANTAKDTRYIITPKATGLWSRGGKTIQAPEWFLDSLPTDILLDGELWAGRGLFQDTSSIVKQLKPNGTDWQKIKYMVFDSPSWAAFAQDGVINEPSYTKTISSERVLSFVFGSNYEVKTPETFDNAYLDLLNVYVFFAKHSDIEVWKPHKQTKIYGTRSELTKIITDKLDQCAKDGDEGLMLRNPIAPWEPKRSNNILKVKRRHDAEAKIIGYIWGKKTDKGSKLLGLMGAMVVKMPNGIVFELSGFTDEERRLTSFNLLAIDEGVTCQGKMVSDNWTNEKFPIGSTITYSYREHTNDGVPKEAQFLRKST